MKIFIRERFLIYVTKIFYVRCFFFINFIIFICNYYCASIPPPPISLSAQCFFVDALPSLSFFAYSYSYTRYLDSLFSFYFSNFHDDGESRRRSLIEYSSIDSSWLNYKRERNALSQIVWALIAKLRRIAFLSFFVGIIERKRKIFQYK